MIFFVPLRLKNMVHEFITVSTQMHCHYLVAQLFIYISSLFISKLLIMTFKVIIRVYLNVWAEMYYMLHIKKCVYIFFSFKYKK